MSRFENDYRTLMDGISLSDSARASLHAAVQKHREEPSPESHGQDAAAPSHPLARRTFLAYGAAAIVALVAIGVGVPENAARIVQSLVSGGPARGNARWFSLQAYAAEPENEPAAGTAVELTHFFVAGASYSTDTDRMVVSFQFDFSLAGVGITSTTFEFETPQNDQNTLFAKPPTVCEDTVLFHTYRTYQRETTSTDAFPNGLPPDSEIVIEPGRYERSITVEGNESIGQFGTRRDGGITRHVAVGMVVPEALKAARRREEALRSRASNAMPNESPSAHDTLSAGANATELALEQEEARIHAIVSYEAGLVLEKHPLAVTATFDDGAVETKRYRISPLALDVIEQRCQPDESGNRGPSWNELVGREPQRAPLFTIALLD